MPKQHQVAKPNRIKLVHKLTIQKLKRLWQAVFEKRLGRRAEFHGLSRTHLIRLLDGYIRLLHEEVSTEDFNDALISAYCKSSGKFQAYIHEIESRHQQRMIYEPELVVEIPTISAKSFHSHDETSHSLIPCQSLNKLSLVKDGYHILPCRLHPLIVQQLIDATPLFRYKIKTIKEQTKHGSYADTLDREVVTAYADTKQLIQNKIVRGISLDSSILRAIRDYLGCQRIRLRDVNMWFTRAQPHASSDSAQLYHFDQASIKWVKVFIFLTDVDVNSGPHSAILGTHLPDTKPAYLLSRGYQRITDAELSKAYPQNREHIFIAEMGQILLADTNAWHKGSPVNEGGRLVLELEYTACVEQNPWLLEKNRLI
jgi:hypothetical protein